MPRPRSRRPSTRHTGRALPADYDHVAAYRWETTPSGSIDVELSLPAWHVTHDQGRTQSCVGHAVVMERAVVNQMQREAAEGVVLSPNRYEPLALWRAAKAVDALSSDPDNDEDGTTLLAAYQVVRDTGLSDVLAMPLDPATDKPVPLDPQPPNPAEGVSAFRWATSVDEIRGALATGKPVAIGLRWYRAFDAPERWYGDAWIGPAAGPDKGFHAVCIYGASDERQAVLVKNSWRSYPEVWMPYDTLGALLADDGEAALVVDL